MTGRLSSHKFRRRLAWIVGVGGVLGGIVAGAIAIGNTGKSAATPIDTNGTAWVYHTPAKAPLNGGQRVALLRLSSRFVRTAVLRKHLDSAWPMLGPEMRAGQTRKSWDSGDNNVVPFDAAGIAAWDVAYAYRNDVAIDVALLGAKTSDWAGKTFTIEFKRYPSSRGHWLVASWTPKGVGGTGQVKSLAKLPPPPPLKMLSAKWLLLVPVAFLGSLLLTLAGWGIRLNLRSRRAARRYAELLAAPRSSSNPS